MAARTASRRSTNSRFQRNARRSSRRPASLETTIAPLSSNRVSASRTAPRRPRPCRRALAQTGVVRVVQRGFGLRIREPREHVEEIVPVAFAQRHLAAQADARLVRLGARVVDEPQRRAVRGGDPARAKKRLERLARRPVAVQAQGSGVLAQRLEHRRALEKGGVPIHP